MTTTSQGAVPIGIAAAPVLEPGGYPVVLDYAAALVHRAPGPLAKGIEAALAPRWEELAEGGITGAAIAQFEGFEFPERAEITVRYRYLAGAVAGGLVRSGLATRLRGPHRFDEDDEIFAVRLLREAAAAGAPVEAELPPRAGLPGAMRDLHPGLCRIAPIVPGGTVDAADPATRLLALCRQGAPFDVVGGSPDIATAITKGWCIDAGFDGRPWAWLPAGRRRQVLATMSPADRRAGHARLFHAWPPGGWDYLRRASHAWASREPALIAEQAVPVTVALRGLGPGFSLRHLRSLAGAASALDLPQDILAQLWASVGMLLPDQAGGRPSAQALPLRRRAVRLAARPGHRIERLYDLANHLTRTRTPAALSEARRHYATGFALLPTVDDEEERILREIRLLNGLALVAYHERADAEALTLEEQAHRIADAHAERFPAVARWAKPLLNTNTAKLLVTRFADSEAAASYLGDSARIPEDRVRRRAQIDIARLAFDRGDAAEVVRLLDDVFASTLPDDNEADEAVARAMYAVAALALSRLGAAAEAIARVDHLSRVLGFEGGRHLAAVVRRRIAVATGTAAPAAG